MLSKISPLYWFGLICLLGFVGASLLVPLVLNEDPAYGFNVWRSMQQGGRFNELVYPNPLNPAADKSVFISWWSPGQYLLPAWWSLLTGWTHERSGLCLTVLFTVLGFWGWQKVWKQAGFQPAVITWSLFLMLTSRLTTINFLNYTGGETLIFGGAPWVIWLFRFGVPNPTRLFFTMLIGSLLCFVFKTSSSITLLSLVMVPAAERLIAVFYTKKLTLDRTFWLTSIATGLAFVGYYALTQVFYLSKGTNPTTELNEAFELSYSVMDLVTFPTQYWLSSHDFVSQLGRLYSPFDASYIALLGQLVALGMLVFMVIGVVRLAKQHLHNLALFVAFYGIYTLFLGYFYGRAAEISFETRHFKMVAFLFLPLFLEVIWMRKKWVKHLVLSLLLICNTTYGLVTFALKKIEISQYPQAQNGFMLKYTAQQDVVRLQSIDKEGNLVLMTDPALALEITKARKYLFTYPPDFARKVGFAEKKYITQNRKLYIVYSKVMAADVKAPVLEAIFMNRTFTKIGETPYYHYYESQ